MKILINTSNLKKGGGLQVAHSFLTEIKNKNTHQFHVVLSSALSEQLEVDEYPESFSFYKYSIKPGIIKAITGKDAFLSKLETTIKPDCVFSVFGPSYWIPLTKNHIMGYAIPHYIYPESPYFKLPRKYSIRHVLFKNIKKYNLQRSKSTFWVETEDVRMRLAKFVGMQKEDIYVVSNTAHSVFSSFLPDGDKSITFLNSLKEFDLFKFVTITANYQHKNLNILTQIIPLLRLEKIKCKFYLTLDSASFAQFKSYSDYIINIGPIPIEKCPYLYYYTDALFLPTLLECFSASYPEAMKMGKPILTSDLSFARDICGDAAEYFNPLDVRDIVGKIKKIINDGNRREYLVSEGRKQLNKFETAHSRAEKFLQLCEKQIVHKNSLKQI